MGDLWVPQDKSANRDIKLKIVYQFLLILCHYLLTLSIDQLTFGRPVTVHSDHKPLEIILRKQLSAAPKRLQAMMMRIHRYSIDSMLLKCS